ENRLSNLYSNGGFGFGDVITVSSDELHSVYSLGPPVTSPLPSNGKPEPTGRLIKPLGGSANPSEIAIVTATGGRRVFFTYSAFVSLGYVYCNVKPVSDYDSYQPVEGIVDGTNGRSLTDDFSVSVSPLSNVVDPGDSTGFTVLTATSSGRPQAVNLRVDG